jgi:hypothetical protein
LAIRAIFFISCAKRTPASDELLHALSAERGDRIFRVDNCVASWLILRPCAGLIWLDESIGIVGLVHYTLQEFFQKHPEVLPGSLDSMVAEAYSVYLSFDVFDARPRADGKQLEERLQKYIFLHYASRYWEHQARDATLEDLKDLTL